MVTIDHARCLAVALNSDEVVCRAVAIVSSRWIISAKEGMKQEVRSIIGLIIRLQYQGSLQDNARWKLK